MPPGFLSPNPLHDQPIQAHSIIATTSHLPPPAHYYPYPQHHLNSPAISQAHYPSLHTNQSINYHPNHIPYLRISFPYYYITTIPATIPYTLIMIPNPEHQPPLYHTHLHPLSITIIQPDNHSIQQFIAFKYVRLNYIHTLQIVTCKYFT